HRLQGIWHTGSPMSVVLNALRGIYVVVPRNMVQAAGFYNTLFRGDNPAVLIEVLNGYRLKERLPDNLGEFRLPLGIPETVRPGSGPWPRPRAGRRSAWTAITSRSPTASRSSRRRTRSCASAGRASSRTCA